MPQKENLVGQKFNHWLVLEKDIKKSYKNSYYICQCDCEQKTIKSVRADSLKNNQSTSCGCFMRKNNQQLNTLDLTNQKFEDLIVLYKTDKHFRNQWIWHCKCSCGNEIDIPSNYLTGHYKTHCGCKTKISLGEEKIKKILEDNNISFEQEKTFQDCYFQDTHYPARFDFYVNNNYLIEYDGIQHYKYNETGWDNKEKFLKTQEHDKYKNNWCIKNNIPLIRIPYTQYNYLCLEDLLVETSQFLLAGD